MKLPYNELDVRSIDGKVVHRQRGTGPTPLRLAHLHPGFYTLRLSRSQALDATFTFIKR